jgi:hypothetical protein
MRNLVFAVAAEHFIVRQFDGGLAVHDVPTDTARQLCGFGTWSSLCSSTRAS